MPASYIEAGELIVNGKTDAAKYQRLITLLNNGGVSEARPR